MNNLVARHAYLTAGIQRTYAMGKQPPAHIIQELQRLESRAQATMTPMEVQQALQASQTMQAHYLQEHDAQAAMRDANNKGYFAEQLSKDLTGMTPDQLIAAKSGQLIPVKGKRSVDYKANLRNMLQQNGLGNVPYEKFVKVADRVEEIKGAGKSPSDYLKQAFGNKAAAAESLIGAFHISGIGIELGISGEPEADRFEKPTEELQRRTTIADAWARKAMGDKNDFQTITQNIDPTYLENDGIQGDVARAMQKHDMEDQAQERANYTAPEYDIADSGEDYEYAQL